MDMPRLPVTIIALTFSGCVACDAAPAPQSNAPEAIPLGDLSGQSAFPRGNRRSIEKALRSARGTCVDGGGQTVDVAGTIEVRSDMCLTNIKLVQVLHTPDVRPYVSASCPVNGDAEAAWDCGDLVPGQRMARSIRNFLSTRTLFLHSDSKDRPIKVRLSNVTIDRGRDPSGGARADSAGVWIQNADGVTIEGLDISGHGKGYGLFIHEASNLRIDGLAIHDMHWSPYRGEPDFTLNRIANVGWNRMPIHEMRGEGEKTRFMGVRIQEQLAGAFLTKIRGARLSDIRIERIEARLADGTLPWQTDGLTIGGQSEDVEIDGLTVSRSWENVDIVGNHGGVHGLAIRNAELSDSFAFGLKMGGDVSAVSVENSRIRRAGKAGIHIYGDTSRARLRNVDITDVGKSPGAEGPVAIYPQAAISGIEITANDKGTPRGIMFEDVEVHGKGHAYGLRVRGGLGISGKGLRSRGQSAAAVDILPAN